MATETNTRDQRYMFDQSWLAEQRRLKALETIWDPFTFENLAQLDIPAGARCLEVGAGNGSVAAWLCERVGPDGKVVATDLDTRFVALRDAPNLEVRAHDVTRDELEAGTFDLVHTRLLLSHLPAHEGALRRMTAALKPGGWLLVEEFDHITFLPDPNSSPEQHSVWAAWMDAFARLSSQRGLDLSYGRGLMGLLRGQGLEEVRAWGNSVIERGGVPGRDLLLLSVQSLREHLVATGAIDGPAVDRLIEMLSDPSFMWQSQLMVAGRGRAPL